MNSSQEKMFLLHCYSKYGLYIIWYGVTRHNFIVHLSDIFFLLLPASDNEEILQRDERHEIFFLIAWGRGVI